METPSIRSDTPVIRVYSSGGKSLELRRGDLVHARITEAHPSGRVTLRTRSGTLHAHSDVPLRRDASALLKVAEVSVHSESPQIRLQFLHYLETPWTEAARETTAGESLTQVMEELARTLRVPQPSPGALTVLLARLGKALPESAAAMPRGLREELQDLLQRLLKLSGETFPDRLERLLGHEGVQHAFRLLGRDAAGLVPFPAVDTLARHPLRELLRETGVLLEGRLKAVAHEVLAREEEAPAAHLTATAQAPLVMARDLKAAMLQLRRGLLADATAGTSGGGAAAGEGAATGRGAAAAEVLPLLDSLLNDIEGLQLLSRLTEAFVSFLPASWKGLKEGTIALKKHPAGGKSRPYYCLIQLDLEELGRCSAVVVMQGKEFFVSLRADHPPFQAVLRENLAELEHTFRDQGLHLQAVHVTGEEDPRWRNFERLEPFENIISVRI